MKHPKVSVLIPTYNYGQYIKEAIDSVLVQTYKDFELIVVDNCSTDNTIEIVKSIIEKDDRVKLVINETNIGMYRNFNEALFHAKGEYIKFLNSDDKFAKNLLEKFVNVLDNNSNITLVTSQRQYFGDRDDILKSKYSGLQNGKQIAYELLKHGNFIGEPTTTMFRRDSLNIGMFNMDYKMFADFDMWFRLSNIGDVYFIPDVLSYFRIHEEQGTKYLNEVIGKRVTNELQSHLYTLNKAFFDENISGDKYLIEKSFKRITRIISKNSKYTNKYKIFFSLKIYVIYLINSLIYSFRRSN